jgi:SNF2 family DNA or RNA helicase
MQEVKPLWKHQIGAIRTAEKEPDLGLFFEQGTGKSRTMIEILRRLYALEGRLVPTLILCPVIVCENWKREFAMYSRINPGSIVILGGKGSDRKIDLEEIVLNKYPRIIITNYESMQMDPILRLIHQWQPEVLICDESQRLKSPTSVRAKAVASVAALTKHNYILTGTPILASPADLFMQFMILDRGATFGKNFFIFKKQFFEDKNASFKGRSHYFPKWEVKAGAEGIISRMIQPKALRVLKKDCLDLPPFVRQIVTTEMSKEQKKAYAEMYRDFVTYIEQPTKEPAAVVAQMAAVKALRLQQIVSGFAGAEDGAIPFKDCPRIKVLEELLEDLTPHHKVIVWATWHANYKAIEDLCAKMKIGYKSLTGLVGHKDREDNMDAFRNDQRIRVMIANQSAGGVGVNLVEASYAIYYSKGFKLEDDLQSEARNYRGGSEIHQKVTRIDIICPGTIDELVTDALAKKQRVSDEILSWKDKINDIDKQK